LIRPLVDFLHRAIRSFHSNPHQSEIRFGSSKIAVSADRNRSRKSPGDLRRSMSLNPAGGEEPLR
jgi:hypothetical protein